MFQAINKTQEKEKKIWGGAGYAMRPLGIIPLPGDRPMPTP